MAEKKKSSKGENPGSLLVALIVIAAVLAIFFYSSGINLGNVFNTVRYRASDLGPRLVECVTSPSNCKLTNNYNVTPNGFESQSSNSSSSNNNLDQSNTNSENKTNSESNNNQSSTNNSQNSNSESGINNLASAKMSKADALNELNSIPIVASYNKAKYKRWISYETPCWTTREEVLDRQAEKGSITYLDKDDKETKDKSKACSIKSGVWIDPYSKEKVEDPTKLDIDHTGALSWTAKAGGQEWDKQKKTDYANDFDHLCQNHLSVNMLKFILILLRNIN